MASRNILIPTFTGHLGPVTALAASVRAHCGDIEIVLVIAAGERQAFEVVAREYSCRLLEIEELIFEYSGRRVGAEELLAEVGRFRFQALKKLLGVASLSCDVLVMDSESLVTRDLVPLFDGGIAATSVIYSDRPWDKMLPSLTTSVHAECCELLEPQPYWFFESFNWLYSSSLVRELLQHLSAKHGPEWMFRDRPLFECQLYFQYAHQRGAGYRFLTAHAVLAAHFGCDRAAALLRAIYSSPLDGFGIFEYLARFVSGEEYIQFVANPEVLRHFRLMRHEPYGFQDIIGAVRQAAGHDPNYFGEASMHRRPFMQGRIAVIASGRFHHEEDAHNLRHFLRGVDCDLFLGIDSDGWVDAAVQQILQPCRIARVDDRAALGGRQLALREAKGLPERRTKDGRDIGSIAMFDKLAAAWNALLEREAERGERYVAVVRTRPDILATRGLHDILWEIGEHMGSLKGLLLFPNCFWSQGINDQLFLGMREEMGQLFAGLNGAAYIECDFRNPEYFLGSRVRESKLAPVPFPFEYILTRGEQPQLCDIQEKLDVQHRHFWSSAIEAEPWKDARNALDRALANVRIKNGCMDPVVLLTRGGIEMDLLFARDMNGRSYALVSEHKSPATFLMVLPRAARALWLIAIAGGLLRLRHDKAIQFRSFDPVAELIELSTDSRQNRPNGASKSEDQTTSPNIHLRLMPPPFSELALARWLLKIMSLAVRTLHSRTTGLKRRLRLSLRTSAPR